MNRAIEQLGQICKSWGGSLNFVSTTEYEELFMRDHARREGWSDSPSASWHGVVWEPRRVYVVPEHANAGTIVHEMGHVFADHGGNPENSDEWKWLGWEICLARWVRCYRMWSEQNDSYGLGDEWDNDEWGSLTPARRKALIKDRIAESRKWGIIDKFDRPLSVR